MHVKLYLRLTLLGISRKSLFVDLEFSSVTIIFWMTVYIDSLNFPPFVCLALKLLAPLRCGSNPMRSSCPLLTEGCWFTPRNNVFLKLWKLTAIYNQTWLKNGIKHQFTIKGQLVTWRLKSTCENKQHFEECETFLGFQLLASKKIAILITHAQRYKPDILKIARPKIDFCTTNM